MSTHSYSATIILWWILLLSSLWILIRAFCFSPQSDAHTSRVGAPRVGRILLIILGMATLVASQLIGAIILGPAVRAVFGAPFDFESDYESPEAVFQAVVVQTAAAAIAFTTVGIVIGKAGHTTTVASAFWACNPVSLLSGAMVVATATRDMDITHEYIGLFQWVFHGLASPGFYAWLLDGGRRIGSRSA